MSNFEPKTFTQQKVINERALGMTNFFGVQSLKSRIFTKILNQSKPDMAHWNRLKTSFITIYMTLKLSEWFAKDRPASRGQVDPSRPMLPCARSFFFVKLKRNGLRPIILVSTHKEITHIKL